MTLPVGNEALIAGVISRITASQTYLYPNLQKEPVNMLPYTAQNNCNNNNKPKNFADVILRIFRWGIYLGLSKWA